MAKPLVSSKKQPEPPKQPTKTNVVQPPTRQPAPVVPTKPQEAIVTKPQQQALVPLSVDIAADVEQFKDTFDRGSLAIPFLQILQGLSPQLDPQSSKYIEGAKIGQFVNTVTNDVFDALEVIPCYHYATFIEWVTREQGGGFVQDLGLETGQKLLAQCSKNEKGHDVLPNGHELAKTETYFLIIVTEEGPQQVMMPLTYTQIKKARNWNSRIISTKIDVPGKGRVTAPMFFNSYVFETTPESNEKGKWSGLVIKDGRPTLEVGEEYYLAAREFRLMATEGVRTGTIQPVPRDGSPADGGNDEPTPF